jgi:spermidine/putrescine transport system permease protein
MIGPPALVLVILFLLPLFIVAAYSVMTTGEQGEPTAPLTLSNLARSVDPLYVGVLLRSVRLAAVTTVLCLLLGFPVAWVLSTMRGRVRDLALLALILPSWTNLLVKNYAWIVLLRREGAVNTALTGLGLVSEPLPLLFNEGAVLAGLVHTFLPFMVLPLYASLEKLDRTLIEAARDLGAGSWRRLVRVIVPLSAPGIGAGVILVFVPTLGAFVTPDLLGGARGMMVGNLIQNQMLLTRDWPFGSALSMGLTVASLVAILLAVRLGRRHGGGVLP